MTCSASSPLSHRVPGLSSERNVSHAGGEGVETSVAELSTAAGRGESCEI